MKKEIKVKSNSHSYIEKILNRWKEWLIMYSSIISSAASAGAIAGLSASKNSCFDTPSAFFEMILLFALIVVIFYLGYKYFLREESGYSDEKKNKKRKIFGRKKQKNERIDW